MRKTRSQAVAEKCGYGPSELLAIKEIVLQLRLIDLQRILQGTNRQKIGTKRTLQEEVLKLVDSKNYGSIELIKKIYQQELKNLEASSGSGGGAGGSRGQSTSQQAASTITSQQQHLQQQQQQQVRQTVAVNPIPRTAQPGQISNNAMYQPHMAVQDASRPIHTNGVIVSPYPNITGFPVHPDVRLRKLAFFDVLATLLQPSTLVPNHQASRVQEATFYFHLTPQQATDIASNRDIRNSSKVEHTIQVQLRFCLLETSCEQEDYFPPNVQVKVNNKICNLPNPIPTNKPGVEPKRPPRPVNVTPNIKLSPLVPNHISVTWTTEFNRAFVISVYLVRKLTSSQLLNRLKTKGVKPADFTRGLIKEKLNEDADSEIATTMLKVSLICPLGKSRMMTPCRASTCSHLQCFDASLYLQMNERKPTWNCPVCDKPAVYETLVVDGYFQEVLASPILNFDDSEIQLHKDGSWSTHILKNETQNLDTSLKSNTKVEVILDDLELISETPAKPTSKPQVPGGNSNEPSSTTNDTVDLTLSDSDDDDAPLVKRKAQTKVANPAAAIKQKLMDMSSPVISLDSPSPPSSPVAQPLQITIPNGDNGNNTILLNEDLNSATPTSSRIEQDDPLDPLNFQVNPLALINRTDNDGNSGASNQNLNSDYQNLFPTIPANNWNVVPPYRSTPEISPDDPFPLPHTN